MQLTNRSKQVSNKQMTFAERIYLPAIATGLGITIKEQNDVIKNIINVFKKIN